MSASLGAIEGGADWGVGGASTIKEVGNKFRARQKFAPFGNFLNTPLL